MRGELEDMRETRQSAKIRFSERGKPRGLVFMAALGLAGFFRSACPAQTALQTRPLQNDTLPEPLTVEQAVRIGIERNPNTPAGIAGIAAAAATYHALTAFPPIELNVTGATGNTSAPTVNNLNSDVFIDVIGNLDTSGQRHFQAAGARAQLNATRYRFQESTLTLAQQIRDAYWSLVAAQAQTQIARQSLADVEKVYQLTQTQLTAGEVPRTDVLRASIDVANARQSAVSAQGSEHAALVAFNTLLARSPEAPVHPADSLTTASTTPNLLPDLPPLPDLLRQARQNRPLLQAAAEQVRANGYAVKQAQAARLPDLSIDYQRSLVVPPDSAPLYDVMGVIRFPLLDLGSVRETIRAAQANRRQAEAQALQAGQQIEQQVAQAYADFQQARQLASQYQTDILTPSSTLLDLAQIGYQQGATGILPVIDAETTLRNARVGYINSLLALYKAQDEILAATGAALPVQPNTGFSLHSTSSQKQNQ